MVQAPVVVDADAAQEGIRDTVDSIIVAFILAFVFRAFIVEAFIIPTGSMAPTLYGMHGQIRCQNCAYPFAFNMRSEVESKDFSVFCPNCGDQNGVAVQPGRPYLADNGDRILVLKWPYDIGGQWLGLHRWDVAVFKDPKDSRTNFIKRMIGLSGEVLEIIDGDVYAAPADKVPESIRAKLDPRRREQLTATEQQALDKQLAIQRKTHIAQHSLWLVHYDHDFPPASTAGRTANFPFWSPADGWTTNLPRVSFDGRATETSIALAGKVIVDQYGYNRDGSRHMAVGDTRLEFVLQPRGQDKGYLWVSLTKDRTEFRARLDAGGQLELDVQRPERPNYLERLLETRVPPLQAGRPVQFAIENVDYRVSVEIDGKVVLQTTPAMYGPPPLGVARRLEAASDYGGGQPPNGRASARLGASGLPLDLLHLKVSRDVYYQPHVVGMGVGNGTAGRAIWLRDSEYYACGDNSPQSADSRMWQPDSVSDFLRQRGDYQVGTVPRDQLIGRAFFVYWPAGKRIISYGGLPIIPNVGQMRLIR